MSSWYMFILFVLVTEMEFNSRPVDNTLLWDQANLISAFVWNSPHFSRSLRTDESGRSLDIWVLTDIQKNLLQEWDFGVFANTNICTQLDASLVEVLVDHWWSETNTFRFPTGKMTITLENIYFILGLPIIGESITYTLIKNPKQIFDQSEFSKYAVEDEKVYN